MALGLFGKLPSQGDFVSRRLPWEVTSAWDDWLQAGISDARGRIGADWNRTYMTAPLWRCQFAPGVLGAAGWVGVWFASVDRVGRQFPLVLLEPLPASWDGRVTLLEQDDAFFTVEDAALRALEPRLAFDAFDQSLDGLSVLTGVAPALAEGASRPAAFSDSGPRVIRISADADAAMALQAAEAAGVADCCFFSWGNEQHEPVLLCTDTLPPAERFHCFLDGRWD